jgi:hypothetical protein
METEKELPPEKLKPLWFKRKLYGWGWVPVTWQGWAVIALYILLILLITPNLKPDSTFSDVWKNFILPVAILTFFLIYICYKKGEKPKWQWGKDKGDDLDKNRDS